MERRLRKLNTGTYITQSLEIDVFGVVKIGDTIVLSREDYAEYIQKSKAIRGILNNVRIKHEKVGRIMQDGGSAVDDGENRSDHQKHLFLDFGLSLPSPIHL